MAVEEPPNMRVADPEEFNQTTRLRTLNETRKRAGEIIEATMTRLRTEEGFGVDDRQQILRAAVFRYLMEIEWLAHSAEAEDLLQNDTFGNVKLDPPQRLQQLARTDTEGYPRLIGSPNLTPKQWTIKGINGYLTAPEVFEASWSVTVEKRHGGPERITETQATYMPANVSLNAFRMANKFLNENGIDIELAEKQHRAIVDEDVLEKIEQWRKQNIK